MFCEGGYRYAIDDWSDFEEPKVKQLPPDKVLPVKAKDKTLSSACTRRQLPARHHRRDCKPRRHMHLSEILDTPRLRVRGSFECSTRCRWQSARASNRQAEVPRRVPSTPHAAAVQGLRFGHQMEGSTVGGVDGFVRYMYGLADNYMKEVAVDGSVEDADVSIEFIC